MKYNKDNFWDNTFGECKLILCPMNSMDEVYQDLMDFGELPDKSELNYNDDKSVAYFRAEKYAIRISRDDNFGRLENCYWFCDYNGDGTKYIATKINYDSLQEYSIKSINRVFYGDVTYYLNDEKKYSLSFSLVANDNIISYVIEDVDIYPAKNDAIEFFRKEEYELLCDDVNTNLSEAFKPFVSSILKNEDLKFEFCFNTYNCDL